MLQFIEFKDKIKLMKIFKYLAIIFFIITICVFTSCKKQQISSEDFTETPSPINIKTHQWYYFTQDNFLPANTIDSITEVAEKPWPQATRICSSIQIQDEGYFCVNNLGVLAIDNQIKLLKDDKIFNNTTCGNLLNINNTPIIHIYKNNFFLDSQLINDSNDAFLYQLKKSTQIFYPLFDYSQIDVKDFFVTEIFKKDNSLYMSLKKTQKNKTFFDYLCVNLPNEQLFLSNSQNTLLIETKQISEKSYRKIIEPKDFSLAPIRLKELFERISAANNFYVNVISTADGSNTTYFYQSELSTDTMPLTCEAILASNYTIAVFADGTTFFAGSLPDKYILNSGKALVYRLPKLPKGFIYTKIAVANNQLICGWEEVNFYNTLRSGFISIDLNNILY